MAIADLTAEESSLLRFILDTTYERWVDDSETQIGYLADDPTYESIESMLETTSSFAALPKLVQSIRNKLFAVTSTEVGAV